MSAGSTSLVPMLPGEQTLLTAYLAPQQAPLETQPGCSEVPTSTGTATNSDLQQDSVHSALRQQQAQARVQEAEQAQQSSGHPHLRLLQQESVHSALLRQQQAPMQTQAEQAQQAQQVPEQRLLRPRPQQAWELMNYDSEDSDLDYAPPKPAGPRRVKRTRAKNRCDGLCSMISGQGCCLMRGASNAACLPPACPKGMCHESKGVLKAHVHDRHAGRHRRASASGAPLGLQACAVAPCLYLQWVGCQGYCICCPRRQKEKQAAVCDELEDLRDQIKALQAMNVQQLVRFHQHQEQVSCAVHALSAVSKRVRVISFSLGAQSLPVSAGQPCISWSQHAVIRHACSQPHSYRTACTPRP